MTLEHNFLFQFLCGQWGSLSVRLLPRNSPLSDLGRILSDDFQLTQSGVKGHRWRNRDKILYIWFISYTTWNFKLNPFLILVIWYSELVFYYTFFLTMSQIIFCRFLGNKTYIDIIYYICGIWSKNKIMNAWGSRYD